MELVDEMEVMIGSNGDDGGIRSAACWKLPLYTVDEDAIIVFAISPFPYHALYEPTGWGQ